MSRSGLRVTAVAGVQFRVEPLQRRGLRSRASLVERMTRQQHAAILTGMTLPAIRMSQDI